MYYTARTMYDIERLCGCEECIINSVYDESGNNIAKFSSAEEAEAAARKQMVDRGHDRWGITGPLN